MNWYYVDLAGKQSGPVDDDGLEALGASGGINPETLVWREGMANWQPFREARPKAAGDSPAAPAGDAEAVCAECGNIFPIADTIHVGGSRVCANCKPVFVQKMREGVSIETPGTFTYAGFWIRFGAVFLDGILLGIINIVIRLSVGIPIVAGLGRAGQAASPWLLGGVTVLQLCLAMSYETFMIGKYGATLGKMAAKIHVITADGSKVSYLRAWGRYFSKLVSSITCSIGYIMAGFDEEKRALHDRMCNTRVVRN